mgnify:CR=1 FL=1
MTSQEFSDWLDTCPTHKWEECYRDDDGYIRILFRIEDNEDEEDL